MLILRIDISTTLDVLLHVDQRQLDDTRNQTVVFLRRSTFLRGQLQEHTRCQGHLVLADSVVAVGLALLIFLPLHIGLSVVSQLDLIVFIYLALVIKEHVAGQVAQIVHHAVNTEIVAVYRIFLIYVNLVFFFGPFHFLQFVSYDRPLLVQRQLTHAVDGVDRLVADISHTVDSTL